MNPRGTAESFYSQKYRDKVFNLDFIHIFSFIFPVTENICAMSQRVNPKL